MVRMKTINKTLLMLFAATLFLSRTSFAQEITAINFNGTPLGKVIPDGKVVSFDNRLLGNVTADSLIVDAEGNIIGGVVPQGVAIGNDAKFLGKVGNDGVVRSSTGQVVAKALPTGIVVDDAYEVVGQVIFPGLIYNDDGKIAGRITGDGQYANLAGEQIGVVTPDGYAYRKVGSDYVLDGRLISSKMVVSISGDFIGSVVPGGQVTDFDSKTIGKVKANGFVYNENNEVIGRVVNSGYAFDETGKYIGFVSYNGEVVDKNRVVGKMRADGLIVGLNGEVIGKYEAFSATVNDSKGRYFGRLQPKGEVAKTSVVVGSLGPNGLVFGDGEGYLGEVSATGPVYGFTGELFGHAIGNGSVISLNGTVIGYVIGKSAYNLSGQIVGKVFQPQIIYDTDNNFLGISNISSSYNDKGRSMSISPYGMAFLQSGGIGGFVKNIGLFYTPSGAVAGYRSLNGTATNIQGNNIGKIISQNYIINYKKQIIGREINDYYAVETNGKKIGYVSGENKILNSSFSPVAKILPDGSITTISSDEQNYMPKLGTAYNQKLAIDFRGEILGYADINGNINNFLGNNIGSVVDNGLVVDGAGYVVGFVSDFSGAVDEKCEPIGLLNGSGGVFNHRNVYVGKLLANGLVINDSGAVIGHKTISGPVINFTGQISGFSDIIGKVSDLDGRVLGCLDYRGKLYNSDNSFVAKSLNFGSVIDFKNNIIGYANIKGQIVDNKNNFIGHQQPDGNINSNIGMPLGMVMEYKLAYDFNNKLIGYVATDGSVINNQKEIFAKVDFDGYVVKGNDKIGYALNDPYLYDNNYNVIGYIGRNGDVLSFSNQNLGNVDRGFLVKDGKTIARGNRDYNIRNDKKMVIGQLHLDGNVTDASGKSVGKLSSKGEIVNSQGSIIAVATPLQFYGFISSKVKPSSARKVVYDANGNILGYIDENGNLVDANGNVIGYVDAEGNLVDKSGNVIGRLLPDGSIVDKDGNVIGRVTSEDGYLSRPVYDADGNILGYIDENGNLVDANGNVIGYIDENGNLIDNDGNFIGKFLPDGSLVDKDGNVIGRMSDRAQEKVLKAKSEAPNQAYFVDDDKNVYDEKGKLIGRINEKNEIIDADGNVVGKIDANGNVVDKIGNVIKSLIKKGKAYDINGKEIGNVDTDGRVYNDKNEVVGRLNEKGEVIDANGNIIGGMGKQWLDKIVIKDSDYHPKDEAKGALQDIKQSASQFFRSIGIALTSDGEYLGDILADDTVVNKKGKVIGYKMDEGYVVDDDGELIGIEQEKYRTALSQGLSQNEIFKNPLGSPKSNTNDIFIPAGSFGEGEAYGVGSSSKLNLGPGGGYGPGERYDPVRQAALNAAMQERRQNISVGRISTSIRKESFDGYQKDWSEQGIAKSISSWRVDMSEMIFSDKPIPAVIARAIDTNNPAPITAYVERNVYAEEGRNVIIPSGSRLIGAFGSITAASEGTSESARVQITWERLIRPDGSIFVFSGQTADAQGRAGALGFVDKQLFKKYSLPVLTTMLTSASSYFIASAEDSAGEVETSRQQAATDARENFLDDMESLFDEILADKTDIKAVTYIPAGTRIIIYPNSDLWLRTAERDIEESAKLEQPDKFIDDEKMAAKEKAQERENVAAGSTSVVYDAGAEGENIEAEGKGNSMPLIADKKQTKKTTLPPPPPPSSAGSSMSVPTSGSNKSSSSSDEAIPALF